MVLASQLDEQLVLFVDVDGHPVTVAEVRDARGTLTTSTGVRVRLNRDGTLTALHPAPTHVTQG